MGCRRARGGEISAERLGGTRIEALHIRHDALEGFMPTEEVMTKQRQEEMEDAAAQEVHSVMVRTCARAVALSVIPGNRRRSSIAAPARISPAPAVCLAA
jgi:hypothetical protein